jgi:hypothetical protein
MLGGSNSMKSGRWRSSFNEFGRPHQDRLWNLVTELLGSIVIDNSLKRSLAFLCQLR